MTDQEPFNETFFEDVRVPVRQRVGDENRGWYVAMAMLDFERSGIGGAIGYRSALEDLIEYVRGHEGSGTVRKDWERSEEHTSELQSLMRIPYAVFCLKK